MESIVTGTVSSILGETLPGAHVVWADRFGVPVLPLEGVTTNSVGEFAIVQTAAHEGRSLRISFVGFHPLLIPNPIGNYTVELTPDVQEIDEHTVYGERPKKLPWFLLAVVGVVMATNKRR